MIDLYQLALKIKSEGFAEAIRGLRQVDAQGKKTELSIKGLTSAFVKGGLLERGITSFAKTAVQQLGHAINEAVDAERVMSELGTAVNNAGGDFGVLAPTLNDAAERMAKFSRFSDDTARGALTRMITVSGDTKGALENLGLAADIAAGSHKSLEDAAEVVGKVMTGNTRGLKEYGIETKDAGQALDQLRSKFRGFAEKDGASLQGRLEQIKNAWNDVLLAIGKVITGGDNAADVLGRIRDKLVELSTWIDSNADSWRGWASGAIKWVDEVQKRMEKLERIAHAIYRFTHPGQEPKTIGRDVSSGSSTSSQRGPDFQDVTSGNVGHSTPRGTATGGGGTRGGADRGVPIPDFDLSRVVETSTMERIAQIGQTPEVIDMSDFAGMTTKELKEFFKTVNGEIEEGAAELDNSIATMFAQTLGDGIYNAFAAAFNGEGLGGIFAAFGKTVLAGIGEIFTMMGQQYLTYGIIMSGLVPSLTNPFTAGPAAIAIGAALIALGSALGAVAKGGGGSSGHSAGGFRDRSNTQEIVRLKFVDRPGYANNLSPMQPLQFNIIGPKDPKAQRAIEQIVSNQQRRKG